MFLRGIDRISGYARSGGKYKRKDDLGFNCGLERVMGIEPTWRLTMEDHSDTA